MYQFRTQLPKLTKDTNYDGERSILYWVHAWSLDLALKGPAHEGSWRRDMLQRQNHVLFTHRGHVAGTKSHYRWTHTHENEAGTCPRDMSEQHVPSCVLIIFRSCNTNFSAILSLSHAAESLTCWTLWDMLQGQHVAGMRCPILWTVL